MDDFSDKKVVNIFNDKPKKCNNKGVSSLEFFDGFYCTRMDKDANGNSFVAEKLKKYSQDCNYIVRVMRKVDSKTYLYNYEVPSKKFLEFMTKFVADKNVGEIIEIDRYMTETIV